MQAWLFQHHSPMPNTQPEHEDRSKLLELPPELAGKVWRLIHCSKSFHNLMATSQRTQALMGPAVSSLEFTLKGDHNEPLRGLHPSIQPSIITIKTALAENQSLGDRDHGAYARSGCQAAFRQFLLAFISSPHFRHLEKLKIKVCLFL
jgi:hypothetical protein